MKIICDWENCTKLGIYRAPVEKDNSRNYRLLCIDHIKIFNKKLNFSLKIDTKLIHILCLLLIIKTITTNKGKI